MSERPRRRQFRLDILRRGRLRRDVDDEIALHLDERTTQLIARGWEPAAARLEAQRRFGAMDLARDTLYRSAERREHHMEMRDMLRGLWQDVRHAARALRTRPGFTLAVVATLALGIGANATMFGIVDRLLLRPPAYLRDPNTAGLVYLFRTLEGKEMPLRNVAYQRYRDLRAYTRSFSDMATYSAAESIIGTGEGAHRDQVTSASASFWPLFGVKPALGRFFNESEDQLPAGTPVAVLGYGYWKEHFGGASTALGQALRIDGKTYTIIGVAPQGFSGFSLEHVAVFVPITAHADDSFGTERFGPAGHRDMRWYDTYNLTWAEVAARRKPGVSQEVADADLSAAYVRSIEAARVISPSPVPIASLKLHAALGSPIATKRPNLGQDAKVATWLGGVSLLVLLMACANVANLLVARAMQRRREVAVRVALGVSRLRLIALHLAESLLLALAGGVAGLMVASVGGGLLRRLLIPDIEWGHVASDSRVLGFTALLVLIAGIATGLAPSFQFRQQDVASSLKAGGREGSVSRSRLRATLLIVQGAVSVVMLVGAGLFVRSLNNVRSIDLGFQPDRVLDVQVETRGVTLDSTARSALLTRMRDAAAAIPGVEQAGITLTIPFWMTWDEDISVPGRDSSQLHGPWYLNAVSPEYFATMGTRLIRGRGIAPEDRAGSERVAVISAGVARDIWPNDEAIGKCIKVGADSTPCLTVVGIVQDLRLNFEDEPGRHIYLSYLQRNPRNASVIVRTRGRASESQRQVERAMQAIMPGEAFASVRVLQEMVNPAVRSWELGAMMFSLFGALALVVAAVGLYSAIAYSVTQRSHELGVRIALGASTANVLRLVVGEALQVTAIATAIGIGVALFAGKYVGPLLYGVEPRDPLVFVTVVFALAAVAALASLIPARRATRVNPNSALRAD